MLDFSSIVSVDTPRCPCFCCCQLLVSFIHTICLVSSSPSCLRLSRLASLVLCLHTGFSSCAALDLLGFLLVALLSMFSNFLSPSTTNAPTVRIMLSQISPVGPTLELSLAILYPQTKCRTLKHITVDFWNNKIPVTYLIRPMKFPCFPCISVSLAPTCSSAQPNKF